MAVVLRLQGLDVEAGPEDIRGFFRGLPIPEGGVHITGGKLGEAFIIFSTERAGQLAMLCSGKRLKRWQVTLYKSSMAEFKQEMELRLRKRKYPTQESNPPPQTANASDLCTTLLLGLVAAVQGLQSNIETKVQASPSPPQVTDVPKAGKKFAERASPGRDHVPPVNNDVKIMEPTRHHVEEKAGEVDSRKPGFLRLYGLPETITKEEICLLLDGLNVVDVITNTVQGRGRCCLVKMASLKDAEEGLKYGQSHFRVEVRMAHERMWENAVEHHQRPRRSSFSKQDRLSQDDHAHRNFPPKRPKLQRTPPFDAEYCVMVQNLPNTITKTEIRNLFLCPDIPNKNILHLLDKHRGRTSTVFIIYTRPEEYTLAMNMDGSVICSKAIDVSSITKERMRELMQKSRYSAPESTPAYIYARNFPAAVHKADVREFFHIFNLGEGDIELLVDENGNGIGEAVVQFECEERAREARRLHRELFRREPILLTCISPQQRKDLVYKMY